MAAWFVRGLRRGVVTTRYPAEKPEPWTVCLPTPPVFRADAVTAEVADALARSCPSGALRRYGDHLVFDLGACTGCGRCLRDGIAEPSGVWELAATRRTDLIKTIPIHGGRS